jgi:hypothetical protein
MKNFQEPKMDVYKIKAEEIASGDVGMIPGESDQDEDV